MIQWKTKDCLPIANLKTDSQKLTGMVAVYKVKRNSKVQVGSKQTLIPFFQIVTSGVLFK